MTQDEIAEELGPLLLGHPEEMRELALGGATRLGEILYPADLLIYDNYNAVAIGWSFTGKPGDVPVCLPIGTKRILLGFNKGALLDDPEKRLEGEGKIFRRITFSSLDVLDDPYVRGLIDQAVANAKRGRVLEQSHLQVRVPDKEASRRRDPQSLVS
jgi:hypothetical protein